MFGYLVIRLLIPAPMLNCSHQAIEISSKLTIIVVTRLFMCKIRTFIEVDILELKVFNGLFSTTLKILKCF